MAWPEPALKRTHREVIVETMLAWSRNVTGFKGAIEWEIYPFDVGDQLDEDGELMTMIQAFASDTACETLVVIHPDRLTISASALEAFVARLNARLGGIPSLADLSVYGAHPETGTSPFPSFQVLSHSLLEMVSRRGRDLTPAAPAAPAA